MAAAKPRLTAAERVKRAKERYEALKKAAAKADRRKASEEANKQRKIDNRKKILVGAFVLEQMQKSGIGAELLSYDSKLFKEWLTRDSDRELFELEARPVTPT